MFVYAVAHHERTFNRKLSSVTTLLALWGAMPENMKSVFQERVAYPGGERVGMPLLPTNGLRLTDIPRVVQQAVLRITEPELGVLGDSVEKAAPQSKQEIRHVIT